MIGLLPWDKWDHANIGVQMLNEVNEIIAEGNPTQCRFGGPYKYIIYSVLVIYKNVYIGTMTQM